MAHELFDVINVNEKYLQISEKQAISYHAFCLIFHNDNFSPYLRHGFPLMFRKLFAVDALFTSRLWRAIQLRFNEKVACLSGESRVSVILVGEM